jgi:hypothetical protein
MISRQPLQMPILLIHVREDTQMIMFQRITWIGLDTVWRI